MDQDRFLDRFPEILFGSYKRQMLLGIVEAQAVEAILEPLLSDFWEIMPLLAPDLRQDFESILRVYPDVAARYSLRMKPPLGPALPALAVRLRNRRGIDEGNEALSFTALAAEEQKVSSKAEVSPVSAAGKREERVRDAGTLFRRGGEKAAGPSNVASEEQMEYLPGDDALREGQTFIETRAGSIIYLEFSFAGRDDALLFSRKPVETGVDVFLGDVLLLSLPAGEPEKSVTVRGFLEALDKCGPLEGLAPETLVRVEERGT